MSRSFNNIFKAIKMSSSITEIFNSVSNNTNNSVEFTENHLAEGQSQQIR